MNHVADETTELLKQLCTDYQPTEVKKKESMVIVI